MLNPERWNTLSFESPGFLHSDAWLDKARELSKKVHHHLREEERKFFQVSGKILSASRKAQLAGQYRRDYKRMVETLREG